MLTFGSSSGAPARAAAPDAWRPPSAQHHQQEAAPAATLGAAPSLAPSRAAPLQPPQQPIRSALLADEPPQPSAGRQQPFWSALLADDAQHQPSSNGSLAHGPASTAAAATAAAAAAANGQAVYKKVRSPMLYGLSHTRSCPLRPAPHACMRPCAHACNFLTTPLSSLQLTGGV